MENIVRFGIIGTGRISSWVLKGALQEPRFKAVAVCSRSEETAAAFIAAHPEAFSPDARIFTSVEEMSAWDGIDAVYIGTPNSTHCDYTVTALSAGRHVLCEKPLACSAEEVRRMIEASRCGGKVLMEAMISTLNPNFRKVVELLPEIGTIRHYNSSYCQYSTKYDALRQGIVSNSFNPKMGGGALADIGIYTTFAAVSIFGRPEKIYSNLIYLPTEFGNTDIQGTMELSYPGMTAVLSFSKAVDSSLPTEICGEKGNLIMDAVHICRKAHLIPHSAPSSGRAGQEPASEICNGLDYDEYFYEFKEFIDTIESGKIESNVNTHEISLINRELMDTAVKDIPNSFGRR